MNLVTLEKIQFYNFLYGGKKALEAALKEIVKLLVPLPRRNFDHPLSGDWSDHRDCHIKPDLVRLGSAVCSLQQLCLRALTPIPIGMRGTIRVKLCHNVIHEYISSWFYGVSKFGVIKKSLKLLHGSSG
jgi:addiction module RelE/StbE family toxin